jgi:hypothetical protein
MITGQKSVFSLVFMSFLSMYFVGYCGEHDPFSSQNPTNGRAIFSRLLAPVPVNHGNTTPTDEDPLLSVYSSDLSRLSATYPASVTADQPSSGETPVYSDLQHNEPGTGEDAGRSGWILTRGVGVAYLFTSTPWR